MCVTYKRDTAHYQIDISSVCNISSKQVALWWHDQKWTLPNPIPEHRQNYSEICKPTREFYPTFSSQQPFRLSTCKSLSPSATLSPFIHPLVPTDSASSPQDLLHFPLDTLKYCYRCIKCTLDIWIWIGAYACPELIKILSPFPNLSKRNKMFMLLLDDGGRTPWLKWRLSQWRCLSGWQIMMMMMIKMMVMTWEGVPVPGRLTW